MSKDTKRRGISVRGDTYRRLQSLCKAKGLKVASYVDWIVNNNLDMFGVPRFEQRPLKIWTCIRCDSEVLVAARSEQEAAGYVSNAAGGPAEGIVVHSFTKAYNAKNLIPGVLVPDEIRSALAS